jgi:N-acyl homoserine lactone hydrolase
MRLAVLAAAAVIALGAVSASAAGADKLYVLDCGHMSAADQSRWSPGVNVGVPIELSDNCYLIHHPRRGWFLWDTGLPDALAATPEGT